MRLFSDLTNQIRQSYFRKRSFEVVLNLRKNPRHALLEVAADRTLSLHRIRMNRKSRWRRTGTVYVQQRNLSRRTRKHTRSALAALCHDQRAFESFESDFRTKVGSAFTLSARVAEDISSPCLYPRAAMMCAATVNWTLFTDMPSLRTRCDAQQHNWLYLVCFFLTGL